MRDGYGQFGVEDSEDLDLMEIRVHDKPNSWAGVSASGMVYLQGDLHPLGSATALIKAAKENVPYVSVSAVRVLYPSEWLRAECMHDADRTRVIDNLCGFVRGAR